MRIIAHIVDDNGIWDNSDLSKLYAEPEAKYASWGDGRKLGRMQLVQVDSDTWVANLVAKHNDEVMVGSLKCCVAKLVPVAASHGAMVIGNSDICLFLPSNVKHDSTGY